MVIVSGFFSTWLMTEEGIALAMVRMSFWKTVFEASVTTKFTTSFPTLDCFTDVSIDVHHGLREYLTG